MGFCSRRYFFLSVCLLQMLSVTERQIFDFLGFLWIPILVNFFEIVFIIFGFFGAYQYRPKYIISYVLWHLFWLGWNIFIICLYLDVADLDHKTNKVLKFDENSESWWITGGPGCKQANVEPPIYEKCLFDYVHIEIFQAGLQCFLALISVIIGLCLCKTFLEEDDSFHYIDQNKRPEQILLQPMYVENDMFKRFSASFNTDSLSASNVNFRNSNRGDVIRSSSGRNSLYKDQLAESDKMKSLRPHSMFCSQFDE